MASSQDADKSCCDVNRLPPSKLGTREHWDGVYSTELTNFEDHKDPGEIWFGEQAMQDMLDCVSEDLEAVTKDSTVLDLGCGNGVFCIELAKLGFKNVHGIDYSEKGVELARNVAEEEGVQDAVRFNQDDILNSKLPTTTKYDVICDKGTFDAIALMEGDHRDEYIQFVKDRLSSNGYFLVTSCNWTKKELVSMFAPLFKMYYEVKKPTFKFGGVEGTTVVTLAFVLESL